MQSAGTIGSLGKYLKAVMPLPIQVEALHALHNLCKISRQRQEAAASAGLVPYLMNLAQMSPKQVLILPAMLPLRPMANAQNQIPAAFTSLQSQREGLTC